MAPHCMKSHSKLEVENENRVFGLSGVTGVRAALPR
jgi:hypothetical protein